MQMAIENNFKFLETKSRNHAGKMGLFSQVTACRIRTEMKSFLMSDF